MTTSFLRPGRSPEDAAADLLRRATAALLADDVPGSIRLRDLAYRILEATRPRRPVPRPTE